MLNLWLLFTMFKLLMRNRICSYKNVKEFRYTFEVTDEGTSQVNEPKIN